MSKIVAPFLWYVNHATLRLNGIFVVCHKVEIPSAQGQQYKIQFAWNGKSFILSCKISTASPFFISHSLAFSLSFLNDQMFNRIIWLRLLLVAASVLHFLLMHTVNMQWLYELSKHTHTYNFPHINYLMFSTIDTIKYSTLPFNRKYM